MHRFDQDAVLRFAVNVVTLAQQVAVGFQQRLRLAAVEPGVDLGCLESTGWAAPT